MSARPVHRDVAKRVLLGVVATIVLSIVGLIGGITQIGGALPGIKYTYVTADFEDVGILRIGKPIKQGGVQIGTVSAIKYVDGMARTTLRLQGDRPVYRNATASIGNFSALGKKQVIFDPGTADAGPLGDTVLPQRQTSASTSLEDILAAFDPETRESLRDAVDELGQGTAGHGEDLNGLLAASPELMRDLGKLTSAASSPETQLSGLIASGDRLTSGFRGRTDELSNLMEDGSVTLRAVDVDGGEPLEETLEELPGTLKSTREALSDLEAPVADLRVAFTELKPGARALGEATPDLRAFLRDSPRSLDLIPDVADLAEPALEVLTLVLHDALPLMPTLTAAVQDLAELLSRFVPYAGDAGKFFSQHDLLSGTLDGDPNRHYFAATLTMPGLFSVAGVPDPFYKREPYPCPLEAWNKDTFTDCKEGPR